MSPAFNQANRSLPPTIVLGVGEAAVGAISAIPEALKELGVDVHCAAGVVRIAGATVHFSAGRVLSELESFNDPTAGSNPAAGRADDERARLARLCAMVRLEESSRQLHAPQSQWRFHGYGVVDLSREENV